MVNKYVQFFKALSDETRQAILQILEEKELCVNEICERFENISQPTISHHLQVLRNCDLVDIRKEGKLIYYYIKRTSIHSCYQEFFARFKMEVKIE